VNAEKIKYVLLTRHQNEGHNHNMRAANRDFENVTQFKYLRMAVTIQNFIQGEIKSRLNSGNACYHSVQNLLSSRLMSVLKTKKLEYIKVKFCLWVCMCVKLGL
jgi:hypothetical protein